MTTIDQALQQAWHLHQAGQVALAEGQYRQILHAVPHHSAAWCYLGMALHDLGRYSEAEAAYQRALELQPSFPVAFNNLGNTLAAQGRLDEAVSAFHQALALHADYANAQINLANTLSTQGELDAALQAIERALQLAPTSATAHSSRAAVLTKFGRVAEAEQGFVESLRLMPERETAAADLHTALSRTRRVSSSYAEARRNLGLVRLVQEKFNDGWIDFEWRWQTPGIQLPKLPYPLWDGSSPHGKRLLLVAEQGLGDTIHFIRYGSLLKEGGATVLAVVQKPLLPLLRNCDGVDELLAQGSQVPEVDAYVPLMSLPRLLNMQSAAQFPVRVPYLRPDPELVATWRGLLAGPEVFKIGIAWRGSAAHRDNRLRSIPLHFFRSLAAMENVQLISLQKDSATDLVAEDATRLPVTVLVGADQPSQPFMDTAAVMQQLDLVITADTVIAHLAGALGRPVWIALATGHDWRWFLQRQDSPWYPTARLFRQHQPGDWQQVFDRITEALQGQMKDRG